MISSIKGIVLAKEPGFVVIEAGGVGYDILCTQTAYDEAPTLGMEYRIYTRLVIREDSQTLYGFSSTSERELFDLAVAVSGIGPKTGLAIVSALAAPKVREAIVSKDLVTLTAIPGVGKKTAERLIVELRDKLIRDESSGISILGEDGKTNVRSEALSALVSLGYNRQTAEKVIREVIRKEPKEAERLETLIKAALKQSKS
ncbi:MAG TPA: Holliday junction branch migration protein RuvA [Candidatus Kapabacteria bacterium]|nr:Holliday junction branch migration protein RuvA [Candidatus Kapabacteria bacterium]